MAHIPSNSRVFGVKARTPQPRFELITDRPKKEEVVNDLDAMKDIAIDALRVYRGSSNYGRPNKAAAFFKHRAIWCDKAVAWLERPLVQIDLASDTDLIAEVQRRGLVIPECGSKGGA